MPAQLPHHRKWFALALVALVNLAIKLPTVGSQSIWLDEAVSLQAALRPLSIDGLAANDWTPPLYYIVLTGWLRAFGDSIESARVLSVLLSSASAAAIFGLARRHFDLQVALLAAALFTVSRIEIYYSQEARFYALVTLLTVASFDVFLTLRRNGSTTMACVLGILNGALLYTHYIAVFVIVAQLTASMSTIDSASRRWRRQILLGDFVCAALFLPWLVGVVLMGNVPHTGWIKTPSLGTIRFVLKGFAGSSTLLVAYGTLVALAGLSRFGRTGRTGRDASERLAMATVWIWALGPPLLAYVASRLIAPMLIDRYVLYSAVGLYLLVSISVCSLPLSSRSKGAIGAGLVVASLITSVADPHRRHDWRAAAELASKERRNGALIAIGPAYHFRPFAYYFDNAAFRDYRRTEELLSAEGVELVEELDGFHPTSRRILFLVGPEDSFRADAARDRLGARGYELVRRDDLNGLTALVFERPDAA